MKTVNEIKDLIAEKREAILAIKAKADTEKRDAFTAEEKTQFNKLVEERKALESDLETAIELESQVAARTFAKVPSVVLDAPAKADKDVKKYSVWRSLQLAAEGKQLDGVELEMHQEAEKEARSMGEKIQGIGVPTALLKEQRAATATVTTEGGYTIERTLGNLIDTVYDATFMAQLGVRKITGLVGNVDFPTQTGKLTATNYAENATIANSDLVWGQKSLNPVRLGATTQISKQLLQQSSVDVQGYVADQLGIVFQLLLENRVYSAVNTAATEATLSGGTNGIAPTYDHFLQLEEALATANIRGVNFGILTNAKLRKKLKGTTQLANSITQAVWGTDDRVAGYKTAVSNISPSNLVKGSSGAVCSGAIMGNWQEVISAHWGVMDYIVNPYSFAKEGKIEIVAQMFANELVTRNEAFQKFSGFLTT